MKEVKFKQVSIKNFLSIGDEPIDIKFEPGIHIITGINKDVEDSKNGVGKSTISDAIFFAIFGSTLRPIKKEVITNWVNKKECSVTVTFDVNEDGQLSEYVLLRSLNPSRVQLIRNGEDVSRTIGKTNETIYEILGTTSEMFEQSVIMCLNQVEPFLAKTPAVKRKFIEDIFKIEIFGKMTQFIRNDYNETKRLFDFENERLSDLNDNIVLHKKQQTEQIEKKKVRIAELNVRKTDTEEEIKHVENRLTTLKSAPIQTTISNKSEILKSIENLKNTEKNAIQIDREYTKVLAVNQTTVLTLKEKIKELEKLSDGVCAYCKQPFSEDNKQEKRKLIEQYQTTINECIAILEDTENKIKNNQKTKDHIEDQIEKLQQDLRLIENQEAEERAREREIKSLESELKKQHNWLEQLIKDINTVQTEDNSTDNLIAELTAKFTAMEATIKQYKNKLDLIETSKFIVSDEGVKNFIVKKMLKMLNGRLNYYLNQLGANCTCQFNEYFDETIINNRGRECSYFNFSGGERKRIDLAMLFTFMDIRRLQSNTFVNISIYDELLDTSIDSTGIEATLEILKSRVLNNNEAIYIISHKNEAAKHATGEIIYLEKENDITRRRPYDRTFSDTTIPTS